jgi:hypothetical protein
LQDNLQASIADGTGMDLEIPIGHADLSEEPSIGYLQSLITGFCAHPENRPVPGNYDCIRFGIDFYLLRLDTR